MGEEKSSVTEKDPRHETDRLQTEITALRDEIGEAVAELDRRRREAMDIPLQLRRHVMPLTIAAVGVGVVATSAVLYAVLKHRHEQRADVRVKKVKRAAKRAYEHPERVARGEQPMHLKILTAGLTALAGAMAKKLIERAIAPRKVVVMPSAPISDIAVQRPYRGEYPQA